MFSLDGIDTQLTSKWAVPDIVNENYVLRISLSGIKKYRCFKIVIYQLSSKNEWLLLSASFTAILGWLLS